MISTESHLLRHDEAAPLSFHQPLSSTEAPIWPNIDHNSLLVSVYAVVILATFGAVFYIFWARGLRSIIGISVYLLALTSMKLAVKLVYVDCSFNFSKMVTAYHFIFCMVISLIILLHRNKTTGVPIPVPSMHEFFTAILPIAMFFAFSIASNNMALVFASVSFTEIMGASSPLCSIPIVLAMGMPFNMWLLLPTCLVVAASTLSVAGEVSFSAMGVLLCLLANIFRALKTAVAQKVLTGSMSARFEPVALLFWMCIPSALVMLFWSFATEGLGPLSAFLSTTGTSRIILVAALLGSCVNACFLNLAQLFVTKDLGTVGVQLLAQTKSVLTVLSGMVIFHDVVTGVELVGFMGVLFGVWLHARWDAKAKEESQLTKHAARDKQENLRATAQLMTKSAKG